MNNCFKKLLVMLFVAMIGFVPQINAQNRDVTRHRSSSSTTHRSSSSRTSKPARKRSTTTTRKKRTSTTEIILNGYSVDTEYESEDGDKGIAFFVDFDIKNRKNKETYICIYVYQGDNETPILDSDGDILVTFLTFKPSSNNEKDNLALLFLPYYALADSDWDPDYDGISFDLAFEDENENTIGLLEDLDISN